MKIFILINSIVFLLYGIGFMFFTETLSLYVIDTVPNTKSGLIDMRATYAGMSIGFALLLYLTSQDSKIFVLGVKSIILIVGGMALGRFTGIIKEGSPNTLMYIYLLLEVLVVLIGVKLLTKSYKISNPTSS